MDKMKRVLFAASLGALVFAGAPATAQDLQTVLLAQLTEQGFAKVKISRTFLGRVRLFATSSDHTREIIFNPRTGEILRDYWVALDDAGDASARIASPGVGRGSPSVTVKDDGHSDEKAADTTDDKSDDKDNDSNDDKSDDGSGNHKSGDSNDDKDD